MNRKRGGKNRKNAASYHYEKGIFDKMNLYEWAFETT